MTEFVKSILKAVGCCCLTGLLGVATVIWARTGVAYYEEANKNL